MTAEWTYAEYQREVAHQRQVHPEWREGQAHFNVLIWAHSALAERVRGSIIDPFYRDSILPEYLDHLQKEWTS